jgi:hypothetical protein
MSESVILSSASASAERTGGRSGSAAVCQSLAVSMSTPTALAGSRFFLRQVLMNVFARILCSQARRLVPGVNW